MLSELLRRGSPKPPTGPLQLTAWHSFSKKPPGMGVKGAGFGERMLARNAPSLPDAHRTAPGPCPKSVTPGCRASDVQKKETRRLQESPSG